ncbi:MAG: iron ABC transporter substrate-binding protein, partial [Methylocystaceae bacterium]|nr:iron ABC transporter substrate-binding protein [Methylocystaceae bacterium]
MKTLSSIALLVGLCMFAAPSYAQNAEWEATIAAAKKEGQVTVYSGFPGAPEPKEIAKQFEARYGIAVKFL